MRFRPIKNWVIARVAITKMTGTIVSPNATSKTTRFYLLESISPEAEKAGFKVGELWMARQVYDIFLHGGAFHRVTFSIDEAICIAEDAKLSDFVDVHGKPLDEVLAREAA